MSTTFRFHRPAEAVFDARPGLLRKRKPRPQAQRILLASDESSITDVHGTWPIELYRERIAGRATTLTRREADLIVLSNPGVERPDVLEDLHPWLPGIAFLNDSAAGYERLIAIIRRFGQHLVSASDFCDQKWNTICNSVRMKNDLDARFYAAWHLPVQDVWVLEEKREGRCVIAIDCNAMYAACMQHPFPRPSALRLVLWNREYISGETLPSGLYRCVLRGPSDFIRRHNPFRSFFCGRRLGADLSEPLEVDLNEFEIAFYARHFRSIHLIDAVVSGETIPHPLAKEARRAFARRRNYQAQNNKALSDREKYLSTLLASCAGRPARSRQTFSRRDAALRYLQSEYGIKPPEDEPQSATESWLDGRKGVQLKSLTQGVSVETPDLRGGTACFLLGQRIVARGRIVLLEMMEKVLASAPDVEIGYANIDSIHFSLPVTHLDRALGTLAPDISADMGAFKLEAVTRHALWLEPGRYWLFSDAVERFRNRSVGDRTAPFKDHAIQVVTRRIGDLHIPIRATLRMDRTMSDLRSITPRNETGLVRQHLVEVAADARFSAILDQLEENRKRSTPQRMLAFKALKQAMEERPASLPRGGTKATIM